MLKKCTYYLSIFSTIIFISSGFKPFELKNQDGYTAPNSIESAYVFPAVNSSEYKNLNIPFTGKFFIGYKEAIARRESQGQYRLVNTLGYMGKYQFGKSALKAIGISNHHKFLHTPELQEKAFVALCSRHKWELRKEIEKFEGKTVAGVKITESGILAAAHLGGAGSVKRFFKTNGTRYFRDNYGTSIRSYMRLFGGYDTQSILADSNATVIH